MAQEQSINAMRKLVRSSKNDAGHTTAENAIGLALTRVGQSNLGLPLNILSAREQRMTLADLPEIIPDHSLRLIIEGAKGATGLMVLDPDVMGAVTQMQTMGKLCRINPNHRHPTRTDAAMAVDFVDAILGAIEQEMATSPDIAWAGGFRYASWIEESRPLETLLDEVSYRVWALALRLGNGDATGTLFWVIPEQGRSPVPQPKPAITPPTAEDTDWTDRLCHSVMESHVTVDAVLHRLSLPLSAVMGFTAGMDIPLPPTALTDIHLESRRRQLSHGRLGQLKGQRAVLLTATAGEGSKPEPAPQAEQIIDPLAVLKIA